MRSTAFRRALIGIALAPALVAGAAQLVAQTERGRSAMTVGATPAGRSDGAGTGGARPPRGTAWGPDGYITGGMILPPASAVPLSQMDPPAAAAAAPADADDAPDVASAGSGNDGAAAPAPAPAPAYAPLPRGSIVPDFRRAPTLVVSDWASVGLTPPARGQTWIRYRDDAVLIDSKGRVLDSQSGLDWEPAAPTGGYAGGAPASQSGNGDRAARPNNDVQIYRTGPNAPEVTVHRNPDGSTVVVVHSEPRTTTTTTYPPNSANLR